MADAEKAEPKTKDTEMEPKKDEDHEMVDEEEDETAIDETNRKELVSQLMKDPQVLASLQERLHKFLGHPSGYIESLPSAIKRRIKALKKLQLDFTHLEAEFYKEVHALEVKYDQKHQSLYEKRRQIIVAEHEPTDEECKYASGEEAPEVDKELSQDLEEKAKMEEEEKPPTHGFTEDTKGIPEFWLTIFKNVDLLEEMLQDHDEPILANLADIKVKFNNEPMGFILEFHFNENDYFTNKVLTKSYEMKCQPDEEDPFRFEGPEIIRCKGCTIDWKKDKNVTLKTIKKKQKHKTRTSVVRTVTKTVPRDSFFNFFNPPAVPDESEDIDDALQSLLTADFEIGHYLRERIIPRAVLFFTGEALDDEDFEEEDEDGEDGEEGEDEEDDPDYDPTKDKAANEKQECKQQ